MPWTLAIMLSPFRAYAAFAAERDARHATSDAIRGALTQLLVIGFFVSLTTAGRIVVWHVLFSMIAWAFAPAIQWAAVSFSARRMALKVPMARAAALHFAGMGPWYAFFVGIAGVCLFSPSARDAFVWLLRTRLLFAIVAMTLAWGALVTVAMFRSAFGLSWRRTAVATILYYACVIAIVLGYYAATDQLFALF